MEPSRRGCHRFTSHYAGDAGWSDGPTPPATQITRSPRTPQLLSPKERIR